MSGILVVEDDFAVGRVLQVVLAQSGHDVELVRDLSGGRRALNDGNYDLVILDVNLPDGSGLDLLAYLRQELWLKTPVTLLTGLKQHETKLNAAQAGATEYMTKPFSTDELLARVSRWTAS